MKLKSFYDAYDLMEMDIISIKTVEDKLYLLLDCNTHLDLMGNGIRPEFNVSFHHMFIFKNNGYILKLNKNIRVGSYQYADDKIILEVNGTKIILDSDPEVIENYV